MKPFSIRLFSFFFDESRKKESQQRKYGDCKNNLIKTTRMDNKEQVSLIRHLGEWGNDQRREVKATKGSNLQNKTGNKLKEVHVKESTAQTKRKVGVMTTGIKCR